MFFRRSIATLLAAAVFSATPLLAQRTGPILQLDYGHGRPRGNPVTTFMYFVPLISPGPSVIYTNLGNTQSARVLSFAGQTNAGIFLITCEFEFTGAGSLQNIFDPVEYLRQREKELKSGVVLKHQLGAINVGGGGNGWVEVEGALTNGQFTVNEVSIHFNGHGCASPVSVSLLDFAWRYGAVRRENEMVARVNSLIFRRAAGQSKMEVVLGSLKAKGAADTPWQNFIGNLKGATANFFLPPLTIEPEGQKAMLGFGTALAAQRPEFAFPFAKRLKMITNSAP